MKLLLISGLCLLLFFTSIIESGQLNKREKSEECLALMAANPERVPCYDAVAENDAQKFCRTREYCQKFLGRYFQICFSNETYKAEKQRKMNVLQEKCDELENGAMITGAGVVIPTLLVAMAAALN